MLNQDQFEIAGHHHATQKYLSDKEISLHLEVLRCIIGYLKKRQDSEIIIYKLKHEYNGYLDIQDARKAQDRY